MYSFQSRVRYSETDTNERLTLTALFDYLQDCSTFQSEDLGLDLARLRSEKRAWLLAAWNVFVDKMPSFCDEIVVSTWPYSYTKSGGMRNFSIMGTDGTCYARADSRWFMLDMRTMRPGVADMSDVETYMSTSAPRLDLPKFRRKIPLPPGGRTAEPIPVTMRYLDSNMHVNNAQYVGMAQMATGEPFECGRVDVQYLNPATLGDVIVPRVCDVEGGHVVSLESPEGEAFAAVRIERGRSACR